MQKFSLIIRLNMRKKLKNKKMQNKERQNKKKLKFWESNHDLSLARYTKGCSKVVAQLLRYLSKEWKLAKMQGFEPSNLIYTYTDLQQLAN